ncbi:hypothetical protein L3C95_30685 [Chitinophaga filiformis]|uniref:hypothetical protein n=1 Tax=Chitinophaga filiformis TaxID=104663 RepID=UPI001F483B84|nr:hypothetical protein [Chitinophaga filiformis]MCF6407301.1 hypothetical protein [Chitinophaga filiformis]
MLFWIVGNFNKECIISLLKETQAEIDKLYIRIQNARSLSLDDEFTAEDFKEIKADLTRKIEDLEKKKMKL